MNKGCHCLDLWALELIFFILVVGTLPLPFLLERTTFFAIPGFFYVVRFLVVYRSDTSKFLR